MEVAQPASALFAQAAATVNKETEMLPIASYNKRYALFFAHFTSCSYHARCGLQKSPAFTLFWLIHRTSVALCLAALADARLMR